MSESVTLTIDDRQVSVPKGMVVIEAARRIGIEIPRYCYHPYLSIAGNCRMCLVEIEKAPKLQIACSTQVADGMRVCTRSKKVLQARAGVMEFLLINHPLDCPICDQAGECRLQEYSLAHGRGASRFTLDKEHRRKHVDLGPHVVFDEERCIKCTLCIRFCGEVSKTSELALFNRGDQAIIGTFPGRELDNPYSGNTVDICPVGALTLREFRFQSRLWFLERKASVCAGCARGCNVCLWSRDGRIFRITPRENAEVNQVWICDEGRLSYQPLVSRERVLEPLVAGQPASWKEALRKAAALLRGTGKQGPPRVGAIVSSRVTLEELALLRRLCDQTSARAGLVTIEHGEDDALLIRRDKTANRAGARLLGFERAASEVLQLGAEGRLDVLYVMEEELFGPAASRQEATLVRAAVEKVPALVVHGSFRDRVPTGAQVVLPAAVYGEFEGTYINFEGRAQRVRSAVTRAGRSRTHLAILASVALEAGWGAWPDDPASAWRQAQELAPPLAPVSYESVGLRGVVIPPKGAGS